MLQGINIREMLAGAALMDEANRATVVSISSEFVFMFHGGIFNLMER